MMDSESVYEANLDRFVKYPVQAFDAMLELSRDRNLYEGLEKRVKKLLIRCILKIGGTAESYGDCEDEGVEEMARDALDRWSMLKNKQAVAACYLRLLPEEGCRWASQPPWRSKIVELLDNVLRNQVYREWKIPEDMSHEKLASLEECVRGQGQSLHRIIDSLTSFEMMPQHRQKMMAHLNSRSGQILLQPFLPEHFSSSLSEIYKAVERYWSQREGVSIIDAYTNTSQEIGRFKDSLVDFDTIYSRGLARDLGDRLSGIIEGDFSENKAAQPAEVKADARDKKYPLHLTGESVNLGIVIRNLGPGFAHSTGLTVAGGEGDLEFVNSVVEIGRLAPSTSQLIEVPAKILRPNQETTVLGEIAWRNFDGTEHRFGFDMVVHGQRSDIDWVALRQSDPYSLEPVVNEQELVGKRDILNRLLASIKGPNAGSSIIHGQKRVGKTSIAKTLQSHLNNLSYIAVYMEAGDYVKPTALSTIKRLGDKLCQKIIEAEPRASHVPIPDFDQGLSPLTDFLDDANRLIPDRRIVIILDEFDELPSELYVRGTWADSTFLTLRSITSRPNIAFVVVGGEKISHILDYQGDQLNKWAVVPVDYFSRETDWSDYRELVQRPVQDLLEYTEDAVIALHEITAGNPYFTKLICQYVFRQALGKRDCYITRHEIDKATEMAVQETGKNTFQHFWEDGIVESDEKATNKSIRRRKVLVALSDSLMAASPASGKAIAEHPIVRDLSSLEADLREFVVRKVLVGNIVGSFPDQSFDFKVKLFHDWLRGQGVQDVISTFAELDAAMRERQQEEQLRVQPAEIRDLVKNWGIYKGQVVSEEKVRAWLDQFAYAREQRSMFNVLRGLHFYSNAIVRAKMAEIQSMVVRGLTRTIEDRQQKRSDILVSYVDAVGKSGASLGRLYAEEARIYVGNVVEKGSLRETLEKQQQIAAIVFVDDFVGTGQQASANIESMHQILEPVLTGREIKVYFVAITAFYQGLQRVKDTVDKLRLPFEVRACEQLDRSDQYFDEKSAMFGNQVDREYARTVATEYGKALVRDNPIGYGGLGIAVVFEHGCPNDSLPILWEASTNPRWVPLFRRH